LFLVFLEFVMCERKKTLYPTTTLYAIWIKASWYGFKDIQNATPYDLIEVVG
jgi:hypothetical protein